MKAVPSTSTTKTSRSNPIYARPVKRSSSTCPSGLQTCSSGGITKSRSSRQRDYGYYPTESQRQRQAQLRALDREVRGLLEEEYRDDVIAYMHEMEAATICSAQCMDMQPELEWHMRGRLMDFLIEVHLTFRLRPETLYLTTNIIDRYVSRRVVYKKHYQLVGCAALWIAAKFEDAKERVPTVRDLSAMCRHAYDETAFIQMEGHVLQTIGWVVGHPTAESWLRVACSGIIFEDTQTQHVARFLMEITLFHREYVQVASSVVAKAALLLARFCLGKPQRMDEEPSDAVIYVVNLLDKLLAEHLDDVSETLVKKYAPSYYSKASTYIVQFYLSGRRFVYQPPPSLIPVTPTPRSPMWSSASSVASTPSSFSDTSATSSESGDDMPPTPTTPAFMNLPHDPFASSNSGLSFISNTLSATSIGSAAPSISSSSLSSGHGGKTKDKENFSVGASHVTIIKPGAGNENDSLLFSANHRSSHSTLYSRPALHSLVPVNGVPSQVVLR